jgi:predicted patatin/cPLA2 family phospholipase
MLLQGVNAQEVIQLVRERIVDPRSHPERKLALVVEGGAMRGVYTGGTLLGLHFLDAGRAFDVVYGTSSGAVNAAHFLSGLGHLKAATYYKALADGKFFHPLRLHRVVDIDYFVNRVLRDTIPLELERVMATKVPLRIALLNCTDGHGEVVALPQTLPEAWNVITACVSMPLVYNKTVTLGGKQYADGGLPIPFPLQEAIQDGSTDLLVLRSRDPRILVNGHLAIFRVLYGRFFASGKKELMDIYDQWPATINRLSAMASGGQPVKAGVRIATISPDDQRVRSSTMNTTLLRRACHHMARETLTLFGGDTRELDAIIALGVV